MQYTTTTTSKGQVTIPKSVRDKLGLKPGVKIDIYPTEEGFVGKVKRKSKILEYAGDLAHLDKGEPFREIREKAQEIGANEIVKKLYSHSK
jgi:AbrB family looped-hinge helix DNA binding protein